MPSYDGKNLSLTIDGVEFNADGTAVTMDNEEGDADDQTFAELAAGAARQWFLQITARQNFAATSLWRALWENSGADVAFVLRPHGNVTVTADEPHFTGTCSIPNKPPVGGAAGSPWTFDFRLDIEGEPVMDATP